MLTEFDYYDETTLKYIKLSQFNITEKYLLIKDNDRPFYSDNNDYYLNKIQKYNSKYKYVNLYEIIVDNISKGYTLKHIKKIIRKQTIFTNKIISNKDVLLVYDIEFKSNSKERLKFTDGVKYPNSDIDTFNKKIKKNKEIAEKSENIIGKVMSYEKLKASIVKINRKRAQISYESDIDQTEVIFSFLNTSNTMPFIKLKTGLIKLYSDFNGKIDYNIKVEYDIVIIINYESQKIPINIDVNKRLMFMDLKNKISPNEIIDIVKTFGPFKRVKLDKIKDYIGSFNIYGFNFNDVLLSYAIMNIPVYKELLYINEKDTNIFQSRTRSGLFQYHMNSISDFYNTYKYSQLTKNESIIRFSLSKERHSTTELVKYIKKNKIINRTPYSLTHLRVNFSRANNIKTVYLLREYIIRLLKNYLTIENSISKLYKSYGLRYDPGIILDIPESENREITKYKQFDFYDTKGYTKACPTNRRPKILNKSEYLKVKALGDHKKRVVTIKNKQDQKRYLYCPYKNHPHIHFIGDRPCCYNANYTKVGKSKTKIYNIEPQSIFFDFLEIFRAGQYINVNCGSVDIIYYTQDLILKCVAKVLGRKYSPIKVAKNKLAQIEFNTKINIFIINDDNTLKFEKRSSKIDVNNKCILIIKKTIKNMISVSHVKYNNMSILDSSYSLVLKKLYKKQFESISITQSPNKKNITIIHNSKLKYHTYFESIKSKNQILDSNGNTRVIVILKSNKIDHDVYVCIRPVPCNPVSGKIITSPKNPKLPPYNYIKGFFEYKATAKTVNNNGKTVGLWFPFNNIIYGMYVPIEPTNINLNLPNKSPLYVFGDHKSQVDVYRSLKNDSKNILNLVSYLYSTSGLKLSQFKQYIGLDKSIKSYDLSKLNELNKILEIKNKSRNELEKELEKYEKIVPNFVRSGKIWANSRGMYKGLINYITQYKQNEIYFESRLNFEFQLKQNEIIFESIQSLENWFEKNKKYNVTTNLSVLNQNYKSRNPILYKNNGYYLIQTVKHGLFERALAVAYTWRMEKINKGFNSDIYVYEKDENNRLKVPDHIILSLNQYNQIEFSNESKDILRFIVYSGGQFAAILKL